MGPERFRNFGGERPAPPRRQFQDPVRARCELPPAPYRVRKMRIMLEARDHVPVQVRSHVAQAREIDFVRVKHFAQRRLDGQNDAHAMLLRGGWKVGHLLDMRIPDHAAKTGIVGVINQHDAALAVTVKQRAAWIRAKLTRQRKA